MLVGSSAVSALVAGALAVRTLALARTPDEASREGRADRDTVLKSFILHLSIGPGILWPFVTLKILRREVLKYFNFKECVL